MTSLELEKMLYDCQIGMYLSDIKLLENGMLVYSNFVEDSSWNFLTGYQLQTIEEFKKFYDKALTEFKNINRQPCFAYAPSVKLSDEVLEYIKTNFSEYERNTVLLCSGFEKKFNLSEEFSFKQIDNIKDKDLFIKTFIYSKTHTLKNDTYKKLPEYYFKALESSFNHNGEWKFIHFLSMYNNKPIGMLSCCVKGKYAGLYGGGTFYEYRNKGVFTNLLNYVSNTLKKQGVRYFFGYTKKCSSNEKYYNKLGWKEKFGFALYK